MKSGPFSQWLITPSNRARWLAVSPFPPFSPCSSALQAPAFGKWLEQGSTIWQLSTDISCPTNTIQQMWRIVKVCKQHIMNYSLISKRPSASPPSHPKKCSTHLMFRSTAERDPGRHGSHTSHASPGSIHTNFLPMIWGSPYARCQHRTRHQSSTTETMAQNWAKPHQSLREGCGHLFAFGHCKWWLNGSLTCQTIHHAAPYFFS